MSQLRRSVKGGFCSWREIHRGMRKSGVKLCAESYAFMDSSLAWTR